MDAGPSVAGRCASALIVLTAICAPLVATATAEDNLAASIRAVAPRVVTPEQAAELRDAVGKDIRARMKAAEDRESAGWYAMKSRDDWETFRRPRIQALGESIGQTIGPMPVVRKTADTERPSDFEPKDFRTTSRIEGDGFTIENILFTSRPGVIVAGNLYRPTELRGRLPGFLICHSHHAPKTQGELQDMGMTWARQGAAVLVVDMLGHGERRTHDFATADKYPGKFQPGRQDYYFRYNTGLQLAAVGESLLGWMVHDLRCGVTLLSTLPEVDPEKIVLLGAVAGGGDPAGVTGALDTRIAAVVPFNFGGYEPENGYPLPDDAETSFRYAGGSDWESTRCLRRSARDGFLPWTIVASVAPRRLIYAHEFRWDEPRDPVWKRLRAVYGFYDATDHLGSVVGHGGVRQSSAEASHCTNIGPVHRAQLYPLLERWFGLAVPQEYRQRLEPEKLRALPNDLTPQPLHETLRASAGERLAAARSKRTGLDIENTRRALREVLRPLLGTIEPMPLQSSLHSPDAAFQEHEQDGLLIAHLTPTLPSSGRSIPLPMVVLRSKQAGNAKRSTMGKRPIVVAVAQGGKEKLLKDRAEIFAACLAKGATVVVCDLRGTGEMEPREEGRGRTGGATSRSVSEQMLGETTLGSRVRDLRSIVAFLRSHASFQDTPIALYGDGLVAPNDPSRPIAAPLDAADLPKPSEPLGADVCLITSLFEDDIAAIYAGGGLVSTAAILDAPYFYVPHDAIVPGLAAEADLADLVATQTAQVWVADLRDGANRAVIDARRAALQQDLESLTRNSPAATMRRISLGTPSADEIAAWLIDAEPRTTSR